MASVTELFNSRDGGTRGVYGAENMRRLFHVIVDSQTSDPLNAITRTSGGPVLGSAHPWGAFGVVVIGYTPRRLAPLLWEVEALYGVPLAIDPNRPWDVSIDTSLDTYTEYEDLDGQTIGPAIYHPVPRASDYPDEAFTAAKNKLRDERHFDVDGTTFYASTSDDGQQALYQAIGSKRRATGLPRTRPVATMTLSRTLGSMTDGSFRNVNNMVNTVNLSTFFGAVPGVAKFVGMSTRSGAGTIVGQQVPNVVWDVNLVFAIDWDGHNPSNEYDIYEHSDGTTSTIELANGTKIKRSYRLYEELEFNTILFDLDTAKHG